MKIGRPKLRLAMLPEQAAEVRRMYRETKDTRVKERCQSVLLAHGGQHSYQDISEITGRSRSTIQRWIKAFCDDGVASLGARQGIGGGKPSQMRDKRIRVDLENGLKEGRWMTGPQVRDWLHQTYGLTRISHHRLGSVHFSLGSGDPSSTGTFASADTVDSRDLGKAPPCLRCFSGAGDSTPSCYVTVAGAARRDLHAAAKTS